MPISPILIYAPLFIIGCYLRLWHLPSQIFLDDEWHALNFVLERSFFDVVFQHGMGANSIPVNIWFWLTLHTVGWSEITLKLPSIVAGILSLVILPHLVNKLWGTTISLIFTTFLAVSPILIFYSRIVRPFSPAMLFGTASLLLTLLWIRNGRKHHLFLSVIVGFFSFYYHLYSVIPVAIPLMVAAFASSRLLAKKTGLSVAAEHPWRTIVPAACLITVLSIIFIIYPNLTNPWWTKVQGISKSNLGTLLTFLEFIAGTARFKLSYSMFLLLPLGCCLILCRSRTEGIAFLTPIVVFFIVIATYTQDGAHAGIQAARYGIVIFPLSYIALAIALEWLVTIVCKKVTAAQNEDIATTVILTVLILPFILTSPLTSIYHYPNNFTNHSGYQYHYTPLSWDKSPERDLTPGVSIHYNEIPSIYRMPQILSRFKGIIEYPMAVGDQLNLLYYYQKFHGLPVVVGYTRTDKSFKNPPKSEWVYGDRMIDYVMSSIPSDLFNQSVSWSSMVNLEDINTLKKQYPGWLLLLHKNPSREVAEHISEFEPVLFASPNLPGTTIVTEMVSNILGSSFLETNHIIAWSIH